MIFAVTFNDNNIVREYLELIQNNMGEKGIICVIRPMKIDEEDVLVLFNIKPFPDIFPKWWYYTFMWLGLKKRKNKGKMRLLRTQDTLEYLESIAFT